MTRTENTVFTSLGLWPHLRMSSSDRKAARAVVAYAKDRFMRDGAMPPIVVALEACARLNGGGYLIRDNRFQSGEIARASSYEMACAIVRGAERVVGAL
jgi:hypothetical protein